MVGDQPRQWVSLDALSSKAIVDSYLSIKNLRCGHFQGGFFINVDGEPWSDDGTVDEFWMTATWFPALKELLSGYYTAHATPWEESNLTLQRTENEITLEDTHASGLISMPKITLPFFEFTQEMIRHAEKFTALLNNIRREVQNRRTNGVSEEIEMKLKEIENNLPENIEQDVQALVTRM